MITIDIEEKLTKKEEEEQKEIYNQVLNFANSVGGRGNPDYQLLNQILKEQETVYRKFTKDEISRWLDSPSNNENNLRKVHLFLLDQSMFYKRIINYFSMILTFDHLLIPIVNEKKNYKTKAFKKDHFLALEFLEKIKIKDQFLNIMKKVVGEGVGYYYIREAKNDITFQDMPSNYCKIIGKNNIGYEYAMDMSYFDNRLDQLLNYDIGVRNAYKRYKNSKDRKSKFQKFSNTIAPVFKFDEDSVVATPPFIALYYDIIDLFDFKDMIKNKMLLDNWKILFQRIPMKNDKDAKKNDFMLDLTNATQFHKAVKKNLPKGMSVVTSPMEITSVVTERSQGKEGMLGYAENSFYNSAGVSNLLFNSEKAGSIGLKYSIQVDEMFVLSLYRQFERWINYKIRLKTEENKFKILFPDITRFNQEDKIDTYLKTAQFGFPKSLVACAMGLTPNELEGLIEFENATGIIEKLKPLQSSHTSAEKNDVGREKKGLNDNPADSTIVGQDNESNDNRAGA